MPDNVDAGGVPVATRVVTYSGDSGKNAQVFGLVYFTGADDAKVATDATFDANTGGLDNTRRVDLKNIQVASTPLTLATTAYVSGDQMATEYSLANAARWSGGGGYITGVTVNSATANIGPVDVAFTNASVSLAGDNAVWSLSDPDMLKMQQFVQCAANYPFANNRLSQSGSIRIPYTCAATTLYASIIARSGVAVFGANSDLVLTVWLERN